MRAFASKIKDLVKVSQFGYYVNYVVYNQVLHIWEMTKMLTPLEPFYGALELSRDAVKVIADWNSEAEIASSISPLTAQVVEMLLSVPGMTIAHGRDFKRARPLFTLKDETTVRLFINPVGVKHIFLADSENKMIFGGYVGWIHNTGFDEAIEEIRIQFS